MSPLYPRMLARVASMRHSGCRRGAAGSRWHGPRGALLPCPNLIAAQADNTSVSATHPGRYTLTASDPVRPMYLKRLEIHGFKTFAERTELQFSPGITAVIGPNGSGKSNISDAILWVLGENNVRALRGSAASE